MADDRHSAYLAAAREIAHQPLLADFADKVAPAHTALLVVDMQNDFCADGGLVSRDGRDVTPAQQLATRLPRLIDSARAAGVLPVFIRSEYTCAGNPWLSDAWLEQAVRERHGGYTTIPVCEPGKWSADWYGDLRPGPGEPVVTKHRYDAFQGTELDLLLRSRGIRTLVMTGVVTNVCVESTARAGFMRDYYIVMVDDGCAAYVAEDHAHTLRNIRRFFGVVSTIDELCSRWASASR